MSLLEGSCGVYPATCYRRIQYMAVHTRTLFTFPTYIVNRTRTRSELRTRQTTPRPRSGDRCGWSKETAHERLRFGSRRSHSPDCLNSRRGILAPALPPRLSAERG